MADGTQPDLLRQQATPPASDGAPAGSGGVVSAKKSQKKNGHDPLLDTIVNAAGLTAGDLAELLVQAHRAQKERESEDFVWSSQNPDVIVAEQPETAVYLNPRNQVVIRQARAWNEEDDPFVFFSAHNVQPLIDRLQEVLDDLREQEKQRRARR